MDHVDQMIDRLIDRLIEREGGYVNHSNDRGGPTKFGITQETLSGHRCKDATPQDVEFLSRQEASEIYRDQYWIASRLFLLPLPESTAEMVFDTAVLSGPHRAITFLQVAVGALPDGVIGPNTHSAVEEADPTALAAKFMAERVAFLGRIITRSPDQACFAAGWMARSGEMIRLIA